MLNTDTSFFQVLARTHDGEIYTPQVEAEVVMSRKATLSFITDYLNQDQLIHVFESNPSEGWSRDVTEEFAAEAFPEPETDPNEENRIGSFEAGVGRFGDFGRAA